MTLFIYHALALETKLRFRDYDVIINCAGMAAAQLCDDPKLAPVRSHVIKVSAPWIKAAVYADNDTYVIPGNEAS